MSKCSSNLKHVERRADSVKRKTEPAQSALPGFRSCVPAPRSTGDGRATLDAPRALIQSRLRAATRPAMVQVAPGKYVPAPSSISNQKSEINNEITLAHWNPNGDGTYSPLPYTEPMVRVDSKLIHLLGFRGQWHTLARLARAGFVEMIRIAPATTLLNLNSFFNHLARCAEDPEFWDAGKGNIEEYRKSI